MKGYANVVLMGLVVLMIFVSGCVGNASASSSGGVNGLTVTSMQAFGGTKGDTVSVVVNVENRGSVTANNSCLEISGYDWIVKTDPTDTSPTFPKRVLTGATAWYGLGTFSNPSVADDNCQDGGTMSPRKGTTSADKQSVTGEFDTSALLNPIQSQETFKPVAKVWSRYATVATFDLRVMSSTEYDRFINTKGNKETPITYQPTDGPISVQIKGNNPIKLSGGRVPFEIVIANTGGKNTDVFNPAKATGIEGYTQLTRNDYERVRLAALTAGSGLAGGTISCGSYAATPGRDIIRLSPNEDTGRLEATLRCTYTPASAAGVTDTTIKARVELEYGYSVKYDTPLTIKQDTEIDAGSGGTQTSGGSQNALPAGGSGTNTQPGTPSGVSNPDQVIG